MIHHDSSPLAALRACSCGHAPKLIEARGRSITDSRLFGKPARMYHVECGRCALATAPVGNQRLAERMWRLSAQLVPLAQLPALRVAAERLMAAAA